MPTKPTNASIPTTGPARYFRYLAHRCVERPELLVDGVAAAVSPHIAYLDLARGTDRSVLVLGSQRSGSTLLAELIASNPRQRLLFEPLRGQAVGISRHFTRGHYVDPDIGDPELYATLTRIFDGRLRNLWTDRENASRFPRGRVVKDCLGTNLAPFIVHRFPEVPVVYLLRHPIATAYSVTQLGWPDDLDPLLERKELLRAHFSEQLDLIQEIAAGERDTVQAVVLRWCLENAIPTRTLPTDSAHFLFYERLIQEPELELARLADFLRQRSPKLWSTWRPTASLLSRPSGTAWRDASTRPTNRQRVGGWQDDMAHSTLSRSLEVLEAFGLNHLYDDRVDPLIAADALPVGAPSPN
jgi:hypothetical protein